MIFHQVTLENFGIYAGEHSFNLLPESNDRFQQPVILVRGQNGVGKSTFMEAVRLGLYGKLSLGNRTTQREYETYLEQRQHRSINGQIALLTSVELIFDHTLSGHRHFYQVKRSWSKHNNRLVYDVKLRIDGELNVVSEEENDHLLRELMPTGIAELFFFDGEKINTLADGGDTSDALLAETVKNLLGLHLVEQLDRDLDIYLTRQTSTQTLQQHQTSLSQLNQEFAILEQEKEENRNRWADCNYRLSAQREVVAALEARIAREGGAYAAAQTTYRERLGQLKETLARNEQEILELSRGVMPFAVAPRLLRSVRRHLEQEAHFERWQSAQPILDEIDRVSTQKGNTLPAVIAQVINKYRRPPISQAEVVHRLTPETRGVLLNWIDEALTTAPQQLVTALRQRERLQGDLKAVEEMLARVPLEQILQPLQEELRQSDRELGRLEAELEYVVIEDKRLTFQLDRITASKRNLSEQIVATVRDEGRIQLAARTKLLLNDYQQRLIVAKLKQLTEQVTRRFNQLSRKHGFIDRIEIDPDNFVVTIYRAGEVFSRNWLSAGEQQIFAIAILWALREVSGRPLPVIMDTPLSRLDDLHRRSVLLEFIPQVSQQVIVLATNMEIDDQTVEVLRPVLSRAYLLDADSTATQVMQQALSPEPTFITLQEVVVYAN